MEPCLGNDCGSRCFYAQLAGIPSPGLVFLMPVVVLERVSLLPEFRENLSKLFAAAFRILDDTFVLFNYM